MSDGDLSALLGRAREMQERIARLQQELARRTVEGSAGGGMVRVVASGELRVLEVHIEPSALETPDRELLQDLVAAAANDALRRAQALVQEEMQRLAGGALAPPGGGPPGGRP